MVLNSHLSMWHLAVAGYLVACFVTALVVHLDDDYKEEDTFLYILMCLFWPAFWFVVSIYYLSYVPWFFLVKLPRWILRKK